MCQKWKMGTPGKRKLQGRNTNNKKHVSYSYLIWQEKKKILIPRYHFPAVFLFLFLSLLFKLFFFYYPSLQFFFFVTYLKKKKLQWEHRKKGGFKDEIKTYKMHVSYSYLIWREKNDFNILILIPF